MKRDVCPKIWFSIRSHSFLGNSNVFNLFALLQAQIRVQETKLDKVNELWSTSNFLYNFIRQMGQ